MSAPSRVLAALTLSAAVLLPAHAAAALPTADPTPAPGSASAAAVPGAPATSKPVVHAADGASALPTVATKGWVLADLDTGDILAMQDPDRKLRPASTLKLLTALTVAPRKVELIRPARNLVVGHLDCGLRFGGDLEVAHPRVSDARMAGRRFAGVHRMRPHLAPPLPGPPGRHDRDRVATVRRGDSWTSARELCGQARGGAHRGARSGSVSHGVVRGCTRTI
jgi:hypothetical protein